MAPALSARRPARATANVGGGYADRDSARRRPPRRTCYPYRDSMLSLRDAALTGATGGRTASHQGLHVDLERFSQPIGHEERRTELAPLQAGHVVGGEPRALGELGLRPAPLLAFPPDALAHTGGELVRIGRRFRARAT